MAWVRWHPGAVTGSFALVLFVVLALCGPGGAQAGAAVYAVVMLACAVLLVVRASRVRTGRGPWALLAAGALVLVACQGVLVASSSGDDDTTSVALGAFQDHPLIAVLGLTAYPLIYAGQMVLLRQRVKGLLPSAWLDGALVSVVVLAFLSVFAVPALQESAGLSVIGGVALLGRPVLDLVMVTFAAANCALAGWRTDRRLPLVLTSVSLLFVADLLGVLRITAVWDVAVLDVVSNAGRLCAVLTLVAAVGVNVSAPVARSVEGAFHLIAPSIVMLCCGALIVLSIDRNLGPLPVYLSVLAYTGVGVRFVLLHREVMQLADSRRLALTDELTGLGNRRALREELRRARKTRGPLSMLVLDIDGFKTINDRWGQATGDAVLRHSAHRLTQVVSGNGLVARTGGDEFTVLLPAQGESETAVMAAALVAELSKPAVVKGHRLVMGISAGAATVVRGLDHGEAVGELTRQAEVALRLAKASGGGSAVYDESADAAVRDRAQLVEELRTALDPATTPSLQHQHLHPETEQIHVHYQPQIDVRTGDVVGVEALVRWAHPRLGLLGPDAFLDLVELHGLMPDLTTRVLWSAAGQVVAWHWAGHRVRLAVNLSTSCLGDPAFPELLDNVLASTGLDPSMLVVEITETTLMTDPDTALRTTRRITDRGVGLSIDDYGTGYSSMAYLNNLPATELKLDRAFTARLLTDERTAAITATAIDLAHRLGMRMIAEGVEDAETLDALRALGCDETQGYHHSRPLAAGALTAWLRARDDTVRPRPFAAVHCD